MMTLNEALAAFSNYDAAVVQDAMEALQHGWETVFLTAWNVDAGAALGTLALKIEVARRNGYEPEGDVQISFNPQTAMLVAVQALWRVQESAEG